MSPAASSSLTSPASAIARSAVLLAVAALLASCSLGPDTAVDGPASSASTSTAPATGATSTSPPDQATSLPSDAGPDTEPDDADDRSTSIGDLTCEVTERDRVGDVERVELVETSGLAASTRHPGVLWATNDSGQRSGLYAIDQQGADLGFFPLVGDGEAISTADVEDLAIVGSTIYLADIGDNARLRQTVTVYEVAEPEPGTDGDLELNRTIEIRYPDGPTDAEALIVDTIGQELVILSKDLDAPRAPTRLYTAPLGGGDGVVDAVLAGELDLAALTANSTGFSLSTLLFPGAVTAADLVPTGDLIALRTYGSVWLFPRRPDQSVAEALASATPCEIGSPSESQGEAVALFDVVDESADGDEAPPWPRTIGSVTISEGQHPPVNLTIAVLSR